MWTWLAHWTGLDNGSGPIYLFWSGIFSALPSFGVFSLLIGAYFKHACHVKGCPRIGRHKVDGTEWVVCAKHHPVGAPTSAAVTASTQDGDM